MTERIKLNLHFELSNLNSNFALTLGYLNPALNNTAVEPGTGSIFKDICNINHRLQARGWPGGVGGRYSTSFYTGRLRPEVQPIAILHTIFHEEGTLSYAFY